jgi:hypothetical protein
MKTSVAFIAAIAFVTGAARVHALDAASTAIRDAQRLADCTKDLDAECVIALSDADSYSRMAPASFEFAKVQSRFFQALRGAGGKYTLVTVASPTALFTADARTYAFIPYVMDLDLKGRTTETSAYFIAISSDGGASWKFFDGRGISEKNIRLVIPGYTDQELPPVREPDA